MKIGIKAMVTKKRETERALLFFSKIEVVQFS